MAKIQVTLADFEDTKAMQQATAELGVAVGEPTQRVWVRMTAPSGFPASVVLDDSTLTPNVVAAFATAGFTDIIYQPSVNAEGETGAGM